MPVPPDSINVGLLIFFFKFLGFTQLIGDFCLLPHLGGYGKCSTDLA
jgi:hypothetical protein